LSPNLGEQLAQVGTPDRGFEGRRDLKSNEDYRAYIAGRLAGWRAPPSRTSWNCCRARDPFATSVQQFRRYRL